jgi:hypothetical protein
MNKLFGLFLLALAFLVPVNTGRATLVSLPSQVAWPGLVGSFNSSPALGTATTLTTAGHYMAYVFVAREDMVVSHVGFRAGSVAGSPTADVRVETVDPTTGLPTGTLWATNTNLVSGTLSANTNLLSALTASATITKGQVFCIKIAYASGTSIGIANINQTSAPQNESLPYVVTNIGTPTKGIFSNNIANIAIGSSSTTFYQVAAAIPAISVNSVVFNNSTAGTKRGIKFTIPMNCRIVGMRWYSSNGNGDYNIAIYDSSGVEISSSSTAYVGLNNAVSLSGVTYGYFDNTVTATAGTTYYAAVEPSSATNVVLYNFVLPSTSYRGATVAGTAANYSTYTTGGGWVDATDTLPFMDIIIDQVDNGAGTGGGGGRIIGG